MVKLEREQDGMPEFGTHLSDVVTNPDEASLPPTVKPAQAWGFAIAKLTEVVESRSS
jgi:pyruvate dehydrogenase (quinone)